MASSPLRRSAAPLLTATLVVSALVASVLQDPLSAESAATPVSPALAMAGTSAIQGEGQRPRRRRRGVRLFARVAEDLETVAVVSAGTRPAPSSDDASPTGPGLVAGVVSGPPLVALAALEPGRPLAGPERTCRRYLQLCSLLI